MRLAVFAPYVVPVSQAGSIYIFQTVPVPGVTVCVGLIRAAMLDQKIGVVMAHAVQMGLGFSQAQTHQPVRIPRAWQHRVI